MGTLLYFCLSSASTEGKPNEALIMNSFLPGNYLIDQIIQFWSGTYFTVPTFALKTGESTSGGTGTIISQLLAIDLDLNWVLALTKYSIFDRVKFSTTQSAQIRGFTCVSTLYVIKSNSPSGGIKDMHLSCSNLAKRTHWWNLISSISISLPRDVRPYFSKSSLSFKPNFSSGMPLRYDRIRTRPMISELSTVPLAETRMFSFSMTSRKTSFLKCLMPSGLHETTLEAAVGTVKSVILSYFFFLPSVASLLASVLMNS